MWKVQYRVTDGLDPSRTLLLGSASDIPLAEVMRRLGARIEAQLDVLDLCEGLDPSRVLVLMTITEPPISSSNSSDVAPVDESHPLRTRR